MLRDDDLGAAFVQLRDERVAVEVLVGDQPVKGDAIDQRRTSTLPYYWPGISRKRTKLPSADGDGGCRSS